MREKFEAEQEETVPAFLEEPVTPTIPLFIQRQGIVEQEAQNKAQDAGQEAESKAEQKIESNTANRGALRGTAVHRVMECYDFTSEKSVHEQMEAMEKEEKITADMRALVKEQTVCLLYTSFSVIRAYHCLRDDGCRRGFLPLQGRAGTFFHE